MTANSRHASVEQVGEGVLEVKVDEKAIDGRANKRLVEILSEHFHVSKSQVTIVRGAKSREKLVDIAGASPADHFSRAQKRDT